MFARASQNDVITKYDPVITSCVVSTNLPVTAGSDDIYIT